MGKVDEVGIGTTQADELRDLSDELQQAALDVAPGIHVTDNTGRVLPQMEPLLMARADDLDRAAKRLREILS